MFIHIFLPTRELFKPIPDFINFFFSIIKIGTLQLFLYSF